MVRFLDIPPIVLIAAINTVMTAVTSYPDVQHINRFFNKKSAGLKAKSVKTDS